MVTMKCWAGRGFLSLLLASTVIRGARVVLSGVVTSATGSPIVGATVELVGEGLSTVTSESGKYHLVNDVTTAPHGVAVNRATAAIRNGFLVLSTSRPDRVRISVFDLRGALIARPMDRRVAAGNHAVPILTGDRARTVVIIQTRIGDDVSAVRTIALGPELPGHASFVEVNSHLAKITSAADTVRASKAGYVTKSVPVESLVDTVDIVLDEESTAGEYITTPEKHGWSNSNTVAQNTAAFNAAVSDASAHAGASSTGRGVVELAPGKTYVVNCANGGSSTDKIAGCITFDVPNVEVRTVGKPAMASGNQAVVKFEDWAGQTVVARRALMIVNADNTFIGWLELHGNKLSTGSNKTGRDQWVSENCNGSQAGNGGVMNLVVYESDGLRVKEVDMHDALVDGIYIKDRGGKISDVLMEDIDSHDNRRQGMSIIDAGDPTATWDQVVFRRSKFRNTGPTSDMGGQDPRAGVDIEPLGTSEPSYGITFDSCNFVDNDWRGFVGNIHSDANYLKMQSCRFTGNGSHAIRFSLREGMAMTHAVFQDFYIADNSIDRLEFDDPDGGNDTKLVDVRIVNCDVPEIRFFSGLHPSGNSVDIWKGDFEPVVTTNGRETITVHEGLPQ